MKPMEKQVGMDIHITEEEQLQAGNAFLARLARLANPTNLQLGQREIIAALDAGERLSEHLGIDIAEALPNLASASQPKTISLKAHES